jgi:hypothetical protein
MPIINSFLYSGKLIIHGIYERLLFKVITEDCGLGWREEHALRFAEVPAISAWGGLYPCMTGINRNVRQRMRKISKDNVN